MPIIKLPGGSLRDEIREPLYDTIDLTGTFSSFVNKFFQTAQGKSLSQTNLRREGSLETAVSFRIQGMAIDVQNFTDGNQGLIPRILQESSVELRLGEKLYWQGPLRFVSGRVYTDVSGATDPAVFEQHGFAAVAPVIFHGKHSIDLNPLQTFDVTWTLDQQASPIELVQGSKLRYICSLKGLKRRPVQ